MPASTDAIVTGKVSRINRTRQTHLLYPTSILAFNRRIVLASRTILIMKIRLLPLALALTLVFPAAVLVRAAENSPAPKGEKHGHGGEPDTELGKAMETLNKAWRKLRKQAGDSASNASSLELVATIKAETDKALTLQPDKAKDLPEAERPAYVEKYKEEMKKFIGKIDQLAADFKANDNAAATARIKEIIAVQREAHKEFKRPDE